MLEEVRLGYLPDREGGWDIRKEWKDVLSGGEKQRMAMARLMYHEPRYAFIDEGTSAVSQDVEGLLYEKAKEKGITLITISTRASLKRYHTFNLSLGLGEEGEEWEFERIGTAEEKMGVERELAALKQQLEMVEVWERRKAELDAELRKVWVRDEDEGEGQELPPPACVEREENVVPTGNGERGDSAERAGNDDGEASREREASSERGKHEHQHEPKQEESVS